MAHLSKPTLPKPPTLKVKPPRGGDQPAANIGAPRRGRLLGPDTEQRVLPEPVSGADDPLARDAHSGLGAGLWEQPALLVRAGVLLQAGAQLPDAEGAERGLDVSEDAGREGVEAEPFVEG